MAPGKFNPFSKLTQNAKGLKDPPTGKKTEKRARENPLEEEDDDCKLINYQKSVKKSKINLETEAQDSCKKNILNFFENQQQVRKKNIGNIFQSIAEIKSLIQTDYDVLKENELKQEQLLRTCIKCTRQASEVFRARLETLTELESSYKKQYEAIEAGQKEELKNLMDNLISDIKKLEDKFYKDGKRKSWDFLRRNIAHVMENDDF